jgi:hypothetical protein
MQLAALAVATTLVLAACGNTPSPSPAVSPSVAPSASPSVTASPSAAEAACTGTDLTVTGGPWGGAAGSRGSDITVQNQAASPCLLPAGPTVAMIDPSGVVLLANTPPQGGTGPSLAPGGALGFSLLIGNWCDQGISLPAHFSLALASGTVDIANLAVQSLDDLPPCNGPGQPASISTTAWQ